MGRRVVDVDGEVLGRAPEHVRTCLVWQVSSDLRTVTADQAEGAKRAWLEDVRREWGSCGRAILADDVVVGCVLYAPTPLLPGAAAYPTAPTSPDAVLMPTVWVDPAHRDRGLGRVLVQAMAGDLLTRYGVAGSVRAVEAITSTDAADGGCTPEAGFCSAVGFGERRAHPCHPRMRLDLRACVTWRGEVGQVIDRIRSGMRVTHPRPVPHTREPRDAVSREVRGAVVLSGAQAM